MVQHCCVPLCDYFKGKTGKHGRRISLFNFPQTKNEKRERLAGIRDEASHWKISSCTKVYSQHFMESDFIYRGIGKRWDRRRLKKGTIQTCFLLSKEKKLRPNPKEKESKTGERRTKQK